MMLYNHQVNLAFPQIRKTEFSDLYIIFEATENLAQLYCGKKNSYLSKNYRCSGPMNFL